MDWRGLSPPPSPPRDEGRGISPALIFAPPPQPQQQQQQQQQRRQLAPRALQLGPPPPPPVISPTAAVARQAEIEKRKMTMMIVLLQPTFEPLQEEGRVVVGRSPQGVPVMGPQTEAAAGNFPSMDQRMEHAIEVFGTRARAYAEFLRANPEIVLTHSFRRAVYIKWYRRVQQNLVGVRAPDLRAVQRGLWPLDVGPWPAEAAFEVPSPFHWIAAAAADRRVVVLSNNWYVLGFLSTALYNHVVRMYILHAVRGAHTITKRASVELSHAILLTPPAIHLPEQQQQQRQRRRREGTPDLRLWLHVAASRWVRAALEGLGASQRQQTLQDIPLRFRPADARIEVVRVPTFLNNVPGSVSGVLAPMSDLIIRGPSDRTQRGAFFPDRLPVVLFDPPAVMLFADDGGQPFRFTAGMPAHGLVPDKPMQTLTLQNVRLASVGNATATFSAMASMAIILAGVRQVPRVRLVLSLVFYGGTSLPSAVQDPPSVMTAVPQMQVVRVPSAPTTSMREQRRSTRSLRVFRWTAQVMPATTGWTVAMKRTLRELGMADVRSIESLREPPLAAITSTTTTTTTARLTVSDDDDGDDGEYFV